MKYRAAIFDMDGTILNTLEDLTDSTNYALTRHGFPERTIDEVRHFVGNGIRKLIERAVPAGTGTKEIDEVFDTFAAYYKEHSAIKTRAYDGIPELIKELKDMGVLTAVVSNKADFAVQDLCVDYFPGLFDFAIGEKTGMSKKPAPDMVREAMRQLDVTEEEAVYIGDSEVDLATAQNAGLDVIMVGWGFREESFILGKGAPFVVHETGEIADIISGR